MRHNGFAIRNQTLLYLQLYIPGFYCDTLTQELSPLERCIQW